MSGVHITPSAEAITHISKFPITNSLITTWIVIVILTVVSVAATRKIRIIPKGIQNFFEAIFEMILNLIENVTMNHKQTLKFFPYIATFLIFIVTANWLGLLPGIGSIGFHKITEGKEIFVPLLRPSNTDLNMTLALAIISVILTQIIGITGLGFLKYAGKFLNFKGPVQFFVGILEIFGEIAKLLSFSFRLFGNIFAGEVLLVVIAFLVPFIAPLPFMFLELFFGFIQAFVFSMLTLIFFKIAVTLHEEH